MTCRVIDAPHGSNRKGDNFQAVVWGPIVLARDQNIDPDYDKPVRIIADENGIVKIKKVNPTLPTTRIEFAVPTADGEIRDDRLRLGQRMGGSQNMHLAAGKNGIDGRIHPKSGDTRTNAFMCFPTNARSSRQDAPVCPDDIRKRIRRRETLKFRRLIRIHSGNLTIRKFRRAAVRPMLPDALRSSVSARPRNRGHFAGSYAQCYPAPHG